MKKEVRAAWVYLQKKYPEDYKIEYVNGVATTYISKVLWSPAGPLRDGWIRVSAETMEEV